MRHRRTELVRNIKKCSLFRIVSYLTSDRKPTDGGAIRSVSTLKTDFQMFPNSARHGKVTALVSGMMCVGKVNDKLGCTGLGCQRTCSVTFL